MSIAAGILEPVVQALQIRSPTRWTWFGCRMDGLPSFIERALSQEDARRVIAEQIKQHLYSHFYVTGRVERALEQPSQFDGFDESQFVETLARRFGPEKSWSTGWKVISSSTEEFLLSKDGLDVRFPLEANEAGKNLPESGAS